MTDNRLVYSTDPKLNQRCPKCKEVVSECTCAREDPIPDQVTAKLSLEKAKRAGKTVTVVAGLPASQKYLSELAKELKRGCGSGGTFRIEAGSGFVEIQGDHRDALREILRKKGLLVKG